MHDKVKRMLMVAFVAIVGAFGVVAAPSPAQAVWSDCAAYPGTVCFHQYPDFTGRVWRQYPGQIVGCRSMVPDNFNDVASTAFNSTDDHILYLYEHVGCTGAVLVLGAGDVRGFATTNTWWNNRVSSLRVTWVGA